MALSKQATHNVAHHLLKHESKEFWIEVLRDIDLDSIKNKSYHDTIHNLILKLERQ